MLFNLFCKKKDTLHAFTDLVFMSERGKQNAVLEFAGAHSNFIFIAWFEDTAEKFRQLFKQHGVEETRLEQATYFTPAKFASMQIAFLEHHPLSAKEQKLVENSSQQNFTVYNSLTEPLYQSFGGQRIIELMLKMKYAENEPIQHSMVSKSLQNLQRKIAKQVMLERTASSQEAWMKQNIPKKNSGEPGLV